MTSYAEIKAKLEQEDKKIRKRASYDEHNLQAAEVRYIRGVFPDLEGVFFAVPNGGKRTSRQAAWLKEEGMKAGVSDMLLLKRTSQFGFLCIENKTPKGRQEPEQKVFQHEVERPNGQVAQSQIGAPQQPQGGNTPYQQPSYGGAQQGNIPFPQR